MSATFSGSMVLESDVKPTMSLNRMVDTGNLSQITVSPARSRAATCGGNMSSTSARSAARRDSARSAGCALLRAARSARLPGAVRGHRA